MCSKPSIFVTARDGGGGFFFGNWELNVSSWPHLSNTSQQLITFSISYHTSVQKSHRLFLSEEIHILCYTSIFLSFFTIHFSVL